MRILVVASVLYDAILTDGLVTLRYVLGPGSPLTGSDVYYRDVALFKHQRVVDSVSALCVPPDSTDRRRPCRDSRLEAR